MNEEQKLQQQEERESRKSDLLLMRELDRQAGRSISELAQNAPEGLIFAELNIRIKQYTEMFPYSLSFLALQTVQDFKRTIIPLQVTKLDTSKPIAMLRNGTQVFINKAVVREDFRQGGVSYFVTQQQTESE